MRVLSRIEDSPLQVASFKNHLRIYHSNDDSQVWSALRAAMDSWDTETCRPIRTTTYKEEFQKIPHGYCFGAGPVQSIQSVTYNDKETENDITVPASNYRITYSGALPCLQFLNDYESENYNARWWEVTFTAKGDVSEDIRRALFMLGSAFYDERNELSPQGMKAVQIGWSTISKRHRWPSV